MANKEGKGQGARKRDYGKGNHPGVVLLQRTNPGGKQVWYARYRDPADDKVKCISLHKLGKTNARTRRDWAKRLSKKLRQDSADILVGAKVTSQATIKEAVEDYLERKAPELAPKTVAGYKEGLDLFLEWAKEHGPRRTAQLTAPDLARYRAWLIARPSCRYPDRQLGPVTVNRHLNSLRVALTDFRRLGHVALDSERIRDLLKGMKTTKELPSILRENEVEKLLKAAIRHDRMCSKLTREEKAGGGKPGNTPRYRSIAPFTATVLLTGARVGEVETLRWEDVDFENDEIRILAAKTGHERSVDLGVSPALKELLARLKLKAGQKEYVFGGDAPWPRTLSEASRKRLLQRFGAPEFGWQKLRRTCSAYLVCSPAIFGAASAFLAAKQLGHSVVIAERHYTGLLRGIPPDARTLEAAMGIAELVAGIEPGRLAPTRTRRKPRAATAP